MIFLFLELLKDDWKLPYIFKDLSELEIMGPIAGNRGSGGTGLLIHETFANLITSIETNNHRITATLIEDYLIIVAYAPVVANHQSKKLIDDYIDFIIEVQEIIQKNQKDRRQIVLLGDFNAHLKGYLSEIDDLTGEIFSKIYKRFSSIHSQWYANINFLEVIIHTQLLITFLSNSTSEIIYIEVPQLNTNHILLLSRISIIISLGTQKTLFHDIKLEGDEHEAFKSRLFLKFKEKGIFHNK
ncbi:unnamed protein product [Blepharisma stoltei]|uniref:Endonuclease/exonuclease/phosphatase domain-containing protein n=1 Tax=Blepharisma stoltei TaxID=1481888 RepID=A0AAU9IKC1_9CILI|nr:unnamed protein product [Blepharisma stoltei]